MMAVMNAAMLTALLLLGQDPAPKSPAAPVDRLFLQDRSEIRGEILDCSASGRLKIKLKDHDRPLNVGLEELARLRFTTDEARPLAPAGEQVRLAGGGLIGGRLTSFDGEFAKVESGAGPLLVRRRDLKAILLGAPEAPLPELREDKRDILIREIERKAEGGAKPVRECVADYGFLRSIDTKVLFQVVTPGENGAADKVEEMEFDRSTVRHVYLYRESSGKELPSGLFAKVTLKNGDRWVALLQGITRERVKLFSHLFGVVELEKEKIHTLAFTQQAQLTGGNLLITDQSGIHEFDVRGKEVWTYSQGAQSASVARRLPGGTVLVADPQTNSVYEIRPTGRSGGEIVWRLDEIQYPKDVSRLENGNTLVVEQYNSYVAEYDAKSRLAVWKAQAQYPLSAERLDNGNTLICTMSGVQEVNRASSVTWTADLRSAGIRPYRAARLENGNTLVVDQQKGQIVEFDPRSTVVWKAAGFTHPVQAIRLEDGNTLVLDQGTGKVVEVDAVNPKVRTDLNLKGLSQPQGMTTY
jgi:hypothetical protein